MQIRVIVPPEPFVLPEDISGVSSGDDLVAGMIAAVTAEIDGPDGWLGRCLGPQTLEWRLDCWPCGHIRIPCPPLISVDSVAYLDDEDVEIEVDAAFWSWTGNDFWFKSGWSAPSLGTSPGPVRIIYQAGYDAGDAADGGTGAVPAQAKQAIILSVQHMRSMCKDDLFLRAEEVEGIGRKEYTVSEQAGNIIRTTADRLLQGLRVYS